MAITKLRLQQIQDEVADFAKANIPANHTADPETLHGMLQNLQKTVEMRFGADAIAAGGIYAAATQGQIAEFGAGVANDASIKHLGSGKLILDAAANLDVVSAAELKLDSATLNQDVSGDADILVGGAMALGAESQAITVTNAIVEGAGSFAGTYGAASSLETSAGNLSLTAFAVLDQEGAGVEIDSSVAGYFKAAGGNLELSSSAEASLKGQNLVIDAHAAITETAASKDADYVGAMSFSAGATSEFIATAGDMNVKSEAGDFVGHAGAKMLLTADAALSASAIGMELKGNTGYMQISSDGINVASGADIDMAAANKTEAYTANWTVDAVDFDLDASGEAHLISVDALLAKGSELELKASTTHIRFEDGYRAGATLDAYYANGVKLADQSSDWESYQAAFGNKSLLKAIAESAAGSATAARFIGVVGASEVAASAQCMKSANVVWSKSSGSTASAAYASASYVVGSEFTASELDFSTEVYVNGQKLVQTADFRITDGAVTPADYAGAGTMDIEFTFKLEENDVVEIIIK